MKTISSFATTTILSLAVLAGCDNAADRAAQEAREAQVKADKTAQDSLREAREKTAEAYGEANRKIGETQAKADEKLNEAKKAFADIRHDAQESLTKDLAKVDKRIVDVRTRVETSKVVKQTRTELDKDLKDVQMQSDALRTKVNDVGMTLEANWETVRKDLATRMDNLNKSIDALERKVDGKV